MAHVLVRRATLFLVAAVVSAALAGCCCHRGCGYSPAPACGPCGANFGPAPAVLGAPSSCPTGNCGMYQSGANFAPGATAFLPPVVTTAAVPMHVIPTY